MNSENTQPVSSLSVPPAAETGTPRTDAAQFSVVTDNELCVKAPVVHADFARTLERENAQLRGEVEEGKREALRLANGIYRSEYLREAPQWKPLDTIGGIISQIDNMYAGVREKRDEAKFQLSQAVSDLALSDKLLKTAHEDNVQAVSQRDEAKDQLSAANSALDEAKIKYVRREFIARMDAELIANERKGDWDAYRPKRFDTCAWMTEHTNKLWDALREHDRVKVSEFCADIANIAMKIDVTFGAKQEDIDAARLSQGKQEGGVK